MPNGARNGGSESGAAGAPFQFRIRDLLLVMALVALAVAAAAQQSLLLGAAFVVVGVLTITYWKQWSPASAITFLFVVGTLYLLFAPAIWNDGRGPSRGTICRLNLSQIVFALQSYHDDYGTFPPAYIADETSRPMHSWRVLVLPYLEHETLYKQYRFDEPWDGPNNRKLAGQLVRVYSCPDEKWKRTTETSYVAIVGPHTAWPGDKGRKLSEFADGAANVLLVVEVHDSGIHWMEPRDLHVTQMATTINAPHGQGISSEHPNRAHAAFADGMTRWLPDSLPADVLHSWINVDDGTLPEPAK